ncbi:MAG: hypothetical protein V1904_04565 [Bacteroidota bacterium]
MKKIFTPFLLIALFVFFASCEKEEGAEPYNAEIRIDSLRQDTIQFGMNFIPENLHVYYSVVNNDFTDIHSYVFTVKALNVNWVSYTFVERSNKGIPGNSVISGEAVIGIGGKGLLEAYIENFTFE